jgi:N6-adenosine-specific RNA methylase IME4
MSDRYRTIVADPPWAVTGIKLRPWRIGTRGRRFRATEVPHSFMSTDDICALPVSDLAADDAHLYLWVTAKFNREGIGVQVAAAWGFTTIGEIVWAKPNYGLGAFPRPQHEILLVCRRGTLPFAVRNEGSVQTWNQVRLPANGGKEHSRKPDGAQDLIERASPGPYLELFARRQRLGWDTWGNEALEHVQIGTT